MSDLSPSIKYSAPRWEMFSLFAVCAMAVCVSLGAALVSLSKVLVLVAVLGRMWLDGWDGFQDMDAVGSATSAHHCAGGVLVRNQCGVDAS